MMECRWRHVAREMPLGEFGRGIGFGLFVFDSGRGKHWVDSNGKGCVHVRCGDCRFGVDINQRLGTQFANSQRLLAESQDVSSIIHVHKHIAHKEAVVTLGQ